MTATDQTEKENSPADAAPAQAQPFEADVAKLLHLMVHSVYSDKDVFLRELISNAADACERLRYEAHRRPGAARRRRSSRASRSRSTPRRSA